MKPAEERAKQMRADMPQSGRGPHSAPVAELPPRRLSDKPGDPHYHGPDGEPGSDIHRRQCVSAYVSTMGISKKQAEGMYEKQLAEWHGGWEG